MGKEKQSIVKRSVFSWIFPGNMRLQIALVVVISVTVFARIVPLEMQKRIVNQAIRLKDLELLFLYCGIFLAAVVVASGLKFLVSVLQTQISQVALANMRKDLYHHILTLPLSFFRKTPAGMVVSALVNELTQAGEFVGMAVSTPLINIMTLLGFAGYLFFLDPLLAAICISIYPMVLILVPLLQRKANNQNKKRVDATRVLSSRITETITGIHEVHGNASFHIEDRKYDQIVDKLFRIRVVWNFYKQSVKLCNNFFTNLSPFLIFLIGGYLSMKGRLDLGAMMAFLSAQEKLYDPWQELIGFYQVYQDGRVAYDRTMEYFDAQPEHHLRIEGRPPLELDGSLEVNNLSFVTDDGIRLLNGINFGLKPGEHMALVGFSGSGKSTLAQCIGQIYKYTGGSVLLGGQEVGDISKLDVANNVGFVSQSPFIFNGSIEENLLYSCEVFNSVPGGEPAGRTMPRLDDIIEVLQQTGVFVDVLRFGLNALLKPKEHGDLIARIIRVRENFQRNYGRELADYVEFFDENNYLFHSSVAENLVFGTPLDESFADVNLTRNEFFKKFLADADLNRPLLSLGAELSKQTVDILGNLPPDQVFFEQSPIAPEELDDFKLVVERLRKNKLHQLSDDDRAKLLDLGLRFNPGRHKMVALPTILEELILEGRALFRETIKKDKSEAIRFFRLSEYILNQTILNNILFGKTKTSKPIALEKINQSIIQLLIEEDLLETIVQIGMQFEVGTKGDRLSGGQRQKLAIARTFLKAPRVLILDEATSALDNKSQSRIQKQLETRWKGASTMIAVVHRLDMAKTCDKVAVMKAGAIVEVGPYDDLIAKKGMLYELVTGKK
ncbi:MAG: ABC transporter ATP-binding protein/permease [Pseudomonadota bacterium]